MKVSKTVITRYEVNFVNKKFTPANIAQAILDLEKAGVDIVDADVSIDEGEYRNQVLVLTVTKRTYYDDSTLGRMEK